MHLYLITRGIKHEVDQFITELQGKYFEFPFPKTDEEGRIIKNEKGEHIALEKKYLQCRVCPVQLWDICFPEKDKDVMLATCLACGKGEPIHKRHKKFVWGIRKMLGKEVKEIPEYDKTRKFPINCSSIELVGVGVKEDYWSCKDGKHKNKEDVKPEDLAFEGI